MRSRKAHALSLVSSLICAPGSFRETLLARSLPRRVVVGSSNFDNRSFGLNDELNLALPDRERAAHLHEDFERDAALSRPVDLLAWDRRPWSERLLALLGALVERQQ